MHVSAFNTFPAEDPSVCPLPQLSVPHPKKTMTSRRKMLRCCCCYLVHALLLTSLTSSSQWSPQRHTDAIILRFHGNKDHVSRRRRSRQLGNRRFGTIDASKSAFVALSRGGADETLIQRVKHNVVDDHKRPRHPSICCVGNCSPLNLLAVVIIIVVVVVVVYITCTKSKKTENDTRK